MLDTLRQMVTRTRLYTIQTLLYARFAHEMKLISHKLNMTRLLTNSMWLEPSSAQNRYCSTTLHKKLLGLYGRGSSLKFTFDFCAVDFLLMYMAGFAFAKSAPHPQEMQR